MPIRIEAYTLGGILTGLVSWPGHLRDALEASTELLVERASFVPLDGRPTAAAATVPVVVDDVVLAVPDATMPGPVHAAWHALTVEAGPYRISGELASLPGFDPGRALARPTGEFVLLRDVRVELIERPEAGAVTHPQGLVNRYTVDYVEADLMLGFFFPGARMKVEPQSTVSGAGAKAPVEADAPAEAGVGTATTATPAASAAPATTLVESASRPTT